MHAGEAGLGALPTCAAQLWPPFTAGSTTMHVGEAGHCAGFVAAGLRRPCHRPLANSASSLNLPPRIPSSQQRHCRLTPPQPIHAAIRQAAPHLKSLRIEGSTGHPHPLPTDAASTLTQLTRLELTHPAVGRPEAWLPPALEELVMLRWVWRPRGGGGGGGGGERGPTSSNRRGPEAAAMLYVACSLPAHHPVAPRLQ